MPRLGSYELHTIETGRFHLDGGAMFGIVPKPLWEQHIAADARNRIPLRMRCLLLKGAGQVVLIDCGIGNTFSEKFADIYGIDHESANLLGSLRAAGVAPEDVSDVILTHLHFDHCGGATRRTESGALVPAFPNAQYHVQRAHWEWAQAPTPKEVNSFREDTMRPLSEAGQLHLVDGGGELMPGVHLHLVNGHTRAQQIVRIEGPEGTLVFVADLLPTTAHLAPAWTMAYDVEPLTTIREKDCFLHRALEEEWILFFEHDPTVEVANLRRTERGIQAVRPRSLSALWSTDLQRTV